MIWALPRIHLVTWTNLDWPFQLVPTPAVISFHCDDPVRPPPGLYQRHDRALVTNSSLFCFLPPHPSTRNGPGNPSRSYLTTCNVSQGNLSFAIMYFELLNAKSASSSISPAFQSIPSFFTRQHRAAPSTDAIWNSHDCTRISREYCRGVS